ncbi:metal iron transporter [Kwoniella heveanensis BCC8398]|uniref:Metal iron transporter n=1 Tax=Kwoniella heveanensis BCC8398 TaxID=1296120 RepID=A0A1B9GUB8_9TREE|nr:metal iron transporter [Kwoniella heveanensis BCC8398]
MWGMDKKNTRRRVDRQSTTTTTASSRRLDVGADTDVSIQPWLKRWSYYIWRHLHFVGPGLVSSVAYIDPGNWATDLEAGAKYGYKLLFVVFLAGLAAVVLQLLSVRLGATTSLSLPAQTRLIFIRLQAKYPKYRIPLKLALWTLYVLAEVAIIATDLAELLGSAIALHLLFPNLPLFAGVLITAVDVMIVLVFFRSNKGRQGMLFFEIVIVSLVLAVFVSFMILLKLTNPVWKDVFFGLVPSRTLVDPGALYIGVGIIGATVMPHALFLGSSLASVDRLNMLPIEPSPVKKPRSVSMPSLNPFRRRRPHPRQNSDSTIPQTNVDIEYQSSSAARPNPATSSASGLSIRPETPGKDLPLESIEQDEGEMSKDELDYVKAVKKYEMDVRMFDRIRWVDLHLLHATIDTALSLLGFALTINSSILTLAGAAFFYGSANVNPDDADLFGAFDLIKSLIGHSAAIIFALALLCAGQSASITATLAGQVVSEGFINWKTSPLIRRLITRLIGVIPAAIVASAVGPKGLNTMLVASQVLLSIVLPTVIFPLVYLCSKHEIMTVQGPEIECNENGDGVPMTTFSRPHPQSPTATAQTIDVLPHAGGSTLEAEAGIQPQNAPAPASAPQLSISTSVSPGMSVTVEQMEEGPTTPHRRSKSYVSPKWVTVLGYALFGVVLLANGYVIVQLGLGNG